MIAIRRIALHGFGVSALAGLVCGLFGTSACQPVPNSLCDGVLLTWGFDNHELGPRDDVSDAPGLQIDILLRSELDEGVEASMTVMGEDGSESLHPERAVADRLGQLKFMDVEVPIGRVVFEVETNNGCRDIRTRRIRNVLADDRRPVCEVTFNPEPAPVLGRLPVRAFGIDDDLDPLTTGTQVEIEVFTQLPEMEIRILALEIETGEQSIFESTSDENGRVRFPLSLGAGEQAVRALCAGGPTEFPLSSATFPLLVDVERPDCTLIAPSTRVTLADDIDNDSSNGVQVVAVGQTSASDAIGTPSTFSINNSVTEGRVGVAGQTTAILTVPVGNGDAQNFSLQIADVAGNSCSATASF